LQIDLRDPGYRPQQEYHYFGSGIPRDLSVLFDDHNLRLTFIDEKTLAVYQSHYAASSETNPVPSRSTELITLQVRSVPTSLAGYLPAPSGALVGVALRWPEFLKVARAVLQAVGFHPDSLAFRDAREPNWQRGLKQTAAVISDLLTAAELPAGCRAIPFLLCRSRPSRNCSATNSSSTSRSNRHKIKQ
jgi:hypothetical protein